VTGTAHRSPIAGHIPEELGISLVIDNVIYHTVPAVQREEVHATHRAELVALVTPEDRAHALESHRLLPRDYVGLVGRLYLAGMPASSRRACKRVCFGRHGPYQRARRLAEVVPVDFTLAALIGMTVPARQPVRVTDSPASVTTATLPAPPMNSARAAVVKSLESSGVIAAACKFGPSSAAVNVEYVSVAAMMRSFAK
jgi:hypothetical protein